MSTTTRLQNSRRWAWPWVAGLCLFALLLGALGRIHMRYQAACELRAAGFWPGRKDVWQEVHSDWHKFFRRETWRVEPAVQWRGPTGFAQLRTLDALLPALRRLDIEDLEIVNCPDLLNVDALHDLPVLKRLNLAHCTALQNIDGLQGLIALRELNLSYCKGLENVHALEGLTGLRRVNLSGCHKLSHNSVGALVPPLENATIIPP